MSMARTVVAIMRPIGSDTLIWSPTLTCAGAGCSFSARRIVRCEHNRLAFAASFHSGEIDGHIAKRDHIPPLVLLKRSTAFPRTPSRSVVSHPSLDAFATEGLGRGSGIRTQPLQVVSAMACSRQLTVV